MPGTHVEISRAGFASAEVSVGHLLSMQSLKDSTGILRRDS
jgi:hypothetical protein